MFQAVNVVLYLRKNLEKRLRKLVHLIIDRYSFASIDLLNKLIAIGRNKIMDWRIVVVLAPLAIAASWAIFNIGSAALAQVQKYFNKEG